MFFWRAQWTNESNPVWCFFFLFSSFYVLSDERHYAVHLPSAGWKIQAEKHAISVWDEGTLTNKFPAHLQLNLCTQCFFGWLLMCFCPSHRWANLSSTTCWTVLGSRCLTSLLHSQPGERLTVKTLKWTVNLLITITRLLMFNMTLHGLDHRFSKSVRQTNLEKRHTLTFSFDLLSLAQFSGCLWDRG